MGIIKTYKIHNTRCARPLLRYFLDWLRKDVKFLSCFCCTPWQMTLNDTGNVYCVCWEFLIIIINAIIVNDHCRLFGTIVLPLNAF